MSKLLIIEKQSQVEELIHNCLTTKTCSFDYETTGLQYQSELQQPTILSVSFQPGSSWVLPLAHFDSPFKKTWLKHYNLFCEQILCNPQVDKIAWNLKFEYKWTMRYGHILKGRLMDGMLAKYCLDEEKPHDLKNFVAMMFPKYAAYEEKIRKQQWAKIPLIELSEYGGIDADLTHRSMIFLENKLIDLGFNNLFRNLLMMSTRVLAEAEYSGLLVDRKYLQDTIEIYRGRISKAETSLKNLAPVLKYQKIQKKKHIQSLVNKVQLEIQELEHSDSPNKERLIANRQTKIKNYLSGIFGKKEAWEGINFNSPKQLADFLFNAKHGLRLKPIKSTNSGAPSTDEESLEELKNQDDSGFMDYLLDLRGLNKLNSTYIEGMYPLLDTGNRVHASFKIHGTTTGRLSCSDPNLQNIPRDTTSSDIKKMFITPPGYVYLEVDYSQAELRVVAELAKDKAMIDIFNRGYNIHVATACLVNGGIDKYDHAKKMIKIGDSMDGTELKKPKNKEYLFWVKQKKRAKLINFGILYGQTEKALAGELECTEQEAAEFIEKWFDSYPQVAKWIRKQKKFAHENGYVINLFGRKRRLHNIDAENKWIRLEAERQAVNTPIQGTASDFALFSQVIIREKIQSGEFPIDMYQVTTVHDSIGYYVRPKYIHQLIPKIQEICNNPQTQAYFNFSLKHVNMKVSAEVGRNSWGELVEYDPSFDYTTWAN